MCAYALEEMAWAVAREREEEARQTRPHTEERPESREPLRSRLARLLVLAGIRLDRRAGESALKPANNGCH